MKCVQLGEKIFGSRRPIRVLGLSVVLAFVGGCRPQPISFGPEAMAPIDMATVRGWVAGLAPSPATRYDLRWTFQTQQGAVRGQAALRVVPPDSLRFDYRGPFGRSGAAFLVDEDLVWAVPEGEVELLIQAIPLFWAALGFPRTPPAGSGIFGVETEGSRRWQYGVNGDTLAYAVNSIPERRFLASMRQLDDVLGHVEVNYDAQTNLPTKVTLTFPQTASRFLMDVASIDTTVTFSADVWKRP
ncbi:hypothetical protein ACFL3B_02610 [Gemmatimonadota bacterium]